MDLDLSNIASQDLENIEIMFKNGAVYKGQWSRKMKHGHGE